MFLPLKVFFPLELVGATFASALPGPVLTGMPMDILDRTADGAGGIPDGPDPRWSWSEPDQGGAGLGGYLSRGSGPGDAR